MSFLFLKQKEIKTTSSATEEIARDADKSHSRSSVVVKIDAAYDFLLALNSSLTSIFNPS